MKKLNEMKTHVVILTELTHQTDSEQHPQSGSSKTFKFISDRHIIVNRGVTVNCNGIKIMLKCIWKVTFKSWFVFILEMLHTSVNIRRHGKICRSVSLALTQVEWSKSGTSNEALTLTKLGWSTVVWMTVGERNNGCNRTRAWNSLEPSSGDCRRKSWAWTLGQKNRSGRSLALT
jgi:hypothetical protein